MKIRPEGAELFHADGQADGHDKVNIYIVNPMHNAQYLKFILFWNNILHVSDGLSVHHQESKTAHRASDICHTSSVAAC
jgi:hypothetical protein